MRPDEAVPPQSRSDKAPASSPVTSRDVLREAGIEYSTTSSPDDPHVVVRRADVEGLVREVTEAHNVLSLIAGVPVEGTLAERVGVLAARASTLASARAIRASMDSRRADVERLVRERDDYKAALREVQDNIRASAEAEKLLHGARLQATHAPAPQTAGREAPLVSVAESRALADAIEDFRQRGHSIITADLQSLFGKLAGLRASGTAGDDWHCVKCGALVEYEGDRYCVACNASGTSPNYVGASVAADPSVSDEDAITTTGARTGEEAFYPFPSQTVDAELLAAIKQGAAELRYAADHYPRSVALMHAAIRVAGSLEYQHERATSRRQRPSVGGAE